MKTNLSALALALGVSLGGHAVAAEPIPWLAGNTKVQNGDLVIFQDQCYRAQNNPSSWETPSIHASYFWTPTSCKDSGIPTPGNVVTWQAGQTKVSNGDIVTYQGACYQAKNNPSSWEAPSIYASWFWEPIACKVDLASASFGFGSAWKYNDAGIEAPQDWILSSFDDSQWTEGQGMFGFNVAFAPGSVGDKQPSTVTKLASYQAVFNKNGDPRPTSYYFRKSFNVTAEQLAALKKQEHIYLETIVDDAAIVYLNGQEVARTPLMLEGAVKFDSQLGSERGHKQETDYAQVLTLALPTKALVHGKNTLAVRVVDTYSSKYPDVAFDAKLTFSHEFNGKTDGPYIFYANDDVIIKQRTADGILIKTAAKAQVPSVKVTLPDQLGSFEVQLQQQHAPEAWQYKLPANYVMVSDIEGNIHALVKMLIAAGVMDERFNWTYGSGYLYHMGDMFDRGNYVAESLWLLYHLENQAKAAGGDVRFIMGNHDFMNLFGDWRYLDSSYYQTAAYFGKPLTALYGKDTELGQWLRSKNIVERADGVLFTHAGFNTALVNAFYPTASQPALLKLDDVNRIARSYADYSYSAAKTNKDYLPSRFFWARDVVAPFRSDGAKNSSLWLGGANKVGGGLNHHLARGLAAFGADMMVVGHTVFEQPSFLYGERVLAVDVSHEANLKDGLLQWSAFTNGGFMRYTLDIQSNQIVSAPIKRLATPEYPVLAP